MKFTRSHSEIVHDAADLLASSAGYTAGFAIGGWIGGPTGATWGGRIGAKIAPDIIEAVALAIAGSSGPYLSSNPYTGKFKPVPQAQFSGSVQALAHGYVVENSVLPMDAIPYLG